MMDETVETTRLRPMPAALATAGGRVVGSVLAVEGGVVTAQLLDRAFTGPEPISINDLVAFSVLERTVIGVVHNLRSGRRAEDKVVIEVHLLGEIVGQGEKARFFRGVSKLPMIDTLLSRTSAEEVALVFAQPSAATLRIGRLRMDERIPAYLLTDALLGKHFAVVGSTGSGKSSAVTAILRAMLESCPLAHILVLDPHGEYGAAFGERAQVLDPSNLELPYWLMTFEELAAILAPSGTANAYAEAAILRDALIRARVEAVGPDATAPVTVDTPVPFRLSDLEQIIDEAMGGLNKADGSAPYRHLLSRIARVRNDRRYAFMFQSFMVRDCMDEIIGRLLRIPVEGKPVTVIDLSGVPTEVVDVVVSLLCRLIFEFGLWSPRERVVPTLLVCEEAHRYVPDDPKLGFEPSRRAIDRIAKEGRKYGVSLCLVSQRPADLSASSLSQCGTIVSMRLSNERDQTYVKNALPDGSAWLISALPALGTGEAIIVGDGVPVPMQVRFDPLPPQAQPASRTPAFSTAWAKDDPDLATVRATIDRWRAQKR
jgi:DNA helicase HerA-like ATPase